MSGNWIAVACAEHVSHGRQGGFIQVCHGKGAPLRRVLPGARIAYYSPTTQMGGRDKCQAFTAIGTVKNSKPYQADMGFGFKPFRREVAWHEAESMPIAILQAQLAFTQEKNWGYRLRQGVIEISDADMTLIAEAMFTAVAEPHRLAA